MDHGKGVPPKQHTKNPYDWPRSDKCMSCGKVGHYSNKCTQRARVAIVEDILDGVCENVSDEVAEYIGEDEGEVMSLIFQRILLTPKQTTDLKEIIFLLSYRRYVMSLLTVVMWRTWIKKGAKHTHPYKIWIKKGAGNQSY